MQRHCGRCNTDFDDENSVYVCPHSGPYPQASPMSPVDAVGELIIMELEELMLNCVTIHSVPGFRVSDLVLRSES